MENEFEEEDGTVCFVYYDYNSKSIISVKMSFNKGRFCGGYFAIRQVFVSRCVNLRLMSGIIIAEY